MRVLMLSLDGFDMETAHRLELPTITRLAERGAHARLDSGRTYLTGLAGEQLINGLHPSEGGRQSGITFDPASYHVSQRNPSLPPAFGGVDTVVFDPCYFDIEKTPDSVRGIVDWGSHDPGGPPQERPDGLRAELTARFGASPARPWMYESPWASSERTTAMAEGLVGAVRARSEASRWLLGERMPDWTLAFVNVAEAHSASEGFFHGAVADHPLAVLPTAGAAGDAIGAVYGAIDTLVAEHLDAFPDVHTIVFTPHGMGVNGSDVASMVLLGELMARWDGRSTPDLTFPLDEHGLAEMGPDQSWPDAIWQSLTGSAGTSLLARARQFRLKVEGYRRRSTSPGLDWMPVVRHRPHWKSMRAFALPSYYDGRVRVNVAGREADGIVEPGAYQAVLDDVEAMLRACRDPRTGEPLVSSIDRPHDDPMAATDDNADLIVHWHGTPYGVEHDDLGRIGPIPVRRTGGHTSPYGAAYVVGPGIEPIDLGDRSTFDVLPTAFGLAGCDSPWQLSGEAFVLPVVS